MVPSDLAYHAWFKSCASFFENVSKACSKLNTSNLSLVFKQICLNNYGCWENLHEVLTKQILSTVYIQRSRHLHSPSWEN